MRMKRTHAQSVAQGDLGAILFRCGHGKDREEGWAC